MDILAIIFLWPFIILAAGLVFIAFADLLDYGGLYFLVNFFWLFIVLAIVLFVFARKKGKELRHLPYSAQLAVVKKVLVIFSISLLFPIFIRYLVGAFNESLLVFILGLIIGFALLVWGIFVKHHTTIMYSNIIGGALALVYLYTQLWELGEGARIIAAGFGLIVAVAVSVLKLKDKLV